MQALDGELRVHVVRERREELRQLANKGMSVEEIAQRVDGHRTLTEAELGLIELLTHHTVAEVQGHY